MKGLLVLLLTCSVAASAQWKSYRLTASGDTLNRIDNNDLKQGKWAIKVESLRGEPGYQENGVFKDNKKEGTWRIFTLMGDLTGIENYRWGNKDGKSQYYSLTGPIREESWKAVNPDNPYDTVDVYDPIDPYKVARQVVKIEGSSVKHGTWKYYDPQSGAVVKTENYFLDKLEDQNKRYALDGSLLPPDSTQQETAKAPAKVVPKEVLEFEKKIGKKKVKVIDGRTFQ